MRYKYKRIILLVSFFGIFVFYLLLSLATGVPKASGDLTAEQKAAALAEANAEITANTENTAVNTTTAAGETDNTTQGNTANQTTDSAEAAVSKDPPAVLAADAQTLAASDNSGIAQLFVNYYQACLSGTKDSFTSCVSDADAIDLSAIQKKYKYIESVANTECYVYADAVDNSYLVYVYNELKISGIDMAAPNLSVFHVIRDPDQGTLLVYEGALTADQDTLMNTLNSGTAVQAKIKEVNDKLTAAEQSDSKLAEFISKLQ